MTTYPLGKNNFLEGLFLIRNHEGQKEVTKHFTNAEGLSTQNSILSENILEERR